MFPNPLQLIVADKQIDEQILGFYPLDSSTRVHMNARVEEK
jgi:hypothetical protein